LSSPLTFLSQYKKVFGILGLLVVICLFTAWQAPDSFLKPANLQNTIRWTALFGIISIGVSFVIITGGIDLSIGSVVGLIGCLLAMFLNTTYTPQDLLQVTGVDPAARTLTVGGDAAAYQPADSISFLENLYRIESVSGAVVTVAEPISSGDRVGRLVRVHETMALSDVEEGVSRRGGQAMSSRTIELSGNSAGLRPGDRIQLLYEVGLPQQFVIDQILSSSDQTKIRFLTRVDQRVRPPQAALLTNRSQFMPTPWAIAAVLLIALGIGLTHGLLITRIGLQPFIVTLCGLLIYRGAARYITSDQEQGFGSEYPELKELAKGDSMSLISGQEYVFDIPMPFVYMTLIGIIAAVFLNKTIYGRYILALGRNEEAARYSGINTGRMVIVSYMICSLCAGIAGILFALDLNSIQPSGHGEFYELYAIAAAVLGGCSLRGGEGSILGVVIAAAVMRVLNNAINLVDGIDTSTEFAIIGLVILVGVVVDELVRRLAAKRGAAVRAREGD
jgi:ribose transport system permease protein